jgi:hypothetical protein
MVNFHGFLNTLLKLNLHEQPQPIIERDAAENINFGRFVLLILRISGIVDLFFMQIIMTLDNQ